jgi:plastocyanin
MLGFRLTRTPLAILASAMLALAPAMPPVAAAAGPADWQAGVGIDTADHAIQGNGFFPGDISIHVGDSITWTVHSGEVHTVAFEYGPPPPDPVPALLGFFIVALPTGGPTFDGSGWFNSGLLSTVPSVSPVSSYHLTFTRAGDFQFHCLVHREMVGTVHVRPGNAVLPHDQAFYNRQAIPDQLRLLAKGLQTAAAGLTAALTGGNSAVTLGDGQIYPAAADSVAVLRFLPDKRVVHVGDTVTWTNRDPFTPHTVTLGAEPVSPLPPPFNALEPSGTDAAGHATVTGANANVNSGFLSNGQPFTQLGLGNTFKVTFKNAGTYNYRCAIHDDLGMTGTIVVLPKP